MQSLVGDVAVFLALLVPPSLAGRSKRLAICPISASRCRESSRRIHSVARRTFFSAFRYVLLPHDATNHCRNYS